MVDCGALSPRRQRHGNRFSLRWLQLHINNAKPRAACILSEPGGSRADGINQNPLLGGTGVVGVMREDGLERKKKMDGLT
jgi:hypothetical protein